MLLAIEIIIEGKWPIFKIFKMVSLTWEITLSLHGNLALLTTMRESKKKKERDEGVLNKHEAQLK